MSDNKILPAMENKEKFNDLLYGRFIVGRSFDIYGGFKGLNDLGPVGCAIKNNIIDAWRKHFIVGEGILEIETPAMTPEVVFKTSGHVVRFTDIMVKSIIPENSLDKNANAYRLDHILEGYLDELINENKKENVEELIKTKDNIGNMRIEEMTNLMRKYNIKEEGTGYELTDAFEFNLMFETKLGPLGKETGYLRPEIAQGIFCNFRKLYEFNGSKLPFGAATIGSAYRNEISPGRSLIRAREFQLAEIEYFVHPDDKNHERFDQVSSLIINWLPRNSDPKTMSIGECMADNQTLGYFIGRIYEFLLIVGIKAEYIRFRQHKDNEMAHYASDCWDAEILTSYGWIE